MKFNYFYATSTCLFKINNVVIPERIISLWVPLLFVDAAADNPIGFKTLSGNGVSTFFIKNKPAFSKGPRSLPKNPPDSTILDIVLY